MSNTTIRAYVDMLQGAKVLGDLTHQGNLLHDGVIGDAYKEALLLRNQLEMHAWHSGVPGVVTTFSTDVKPTEALSKVEDYLEQTHWETGWMLSYPEERTTINARRANGTDDNGWQRQIHARCTPVELSGTPAWGLWWAVHVEYSPIERPDWHLMAKDLTWSGGQTDFAGDIGDPGWINVEKVGPSFAPAGYLADTR